jgi:hypothetical protein
MTRLYDRADWRFRLQPDQLARKPLCEDCKERGEIVAATVVDHVIPHKGDERLFFDPGNLRSLCKTCHDRAKKLKETHGYAIGHDATGRPLDPSHPWRSGREPARSPRAWRR